MFDFTVAISTKFVHVAPSHRSTRKPLSFVEPSVQTRSMRLELVAVARRLDGGLTGGVTVSSAVRVAPP